MITHEAFMVWRSPRTIMYFYPPTFKRPTPTIRLILFISPIERLRHRCHLHSMLHQFLPSTPFPHKAHRGREYGSAPLPCLHRPGCEALSFPDMLDVVEDRYLRVTGKDEVAVHAVDGEVRGNGDLGGGETLGDDGAAVDSAGAGRVPERAGVCEDILEMRMSVSEREILRPNSRFLQDQCQRVVSAPEHFQWPIWRDRLEVV